MGLKKLLAKAATQVAPKALKAGLNAVTGGVGGELLGPVLEKVGGERVKQIKDALVQSQSEKKLAPFAEVVEEAFALSQFVKAARADGTLTDEERDAILDAVEDLGTDAMQAMKNVVS